MSSYRNHYRAVNGDRGDFQAICTHDWYEFTRKRLEWLYGPERADQILKGQDARTQLDLAAWQALGREEAA